MLYKKFIFLLLYCLQVFRLFAFLNRKKTIILAYHSITNESKKEQKKHYLELHLNSKKFKRQIEYLTAKYKVISLDTFVESIVNKRKLPLYSVVVTFDDGYMNNFTCAFPILRSLRVPATIFLTTNFIGTQKAFWWDGVEYAIRNIRRENIKLYMDGREVNLSLRDLKDKIGSLAYISEFRKNLSEDEGKTFIEEIMRKLDCDLNEATQKEKDYLALDWDKVREMKGAGISFGSHTANHVILTRCSKEQAEKEIYESKRKIEAELGEECKFFCYPNGNFNKTVKEVLMKVGFLCALTLASGMNDLQTDPYEVRRIGISNSDDFLSFLGKLTGITFFLLNLRNRLIKFEVKGVPRIN